jgi:hypothetical protein
MSYDVGILYRDDMPEQLVLDLANDLREANAEVVIEKRENQPVAMLEWVIPAIAFLITLPYIAKLQELAAEDHYPKIKASLSKFAKKVLRIKQQIVVSAQSPNKVQEDSPISSTFAVWTTTKDGRPVKFLFSKGKDDETYDRGIEKIFDALEHHIQGQSDDAISPEAARLSNPRKEIYMIFDEQKGEWRAYDPTEDLDKR